MKPYLTRSIALLLLLFSLIQCQRTDRQKYLYDDPPYHPAIAGFTSGSVSSGSTITVLLSNDYQGEIEPMTPVPDQLFSFSPAVKGTGYWIDRRTIEFRPEKRLPNDQRFVVDFFVGRLFDLPRKQRSFTFAFYTIPQHFAVELDGLVPYEVRDPVSYQISGVIHTADFMDGQEAASLLTTASQEGQQLDVVWEHDATGRMHTFRVDSVKRMAEISELLLAFDGRTAGIGITESHPVSVPALGMFAIADVQVVHQPEQYVSLRFSDPVKRNQNLAGLIRLQEEDNLRFLVDGNEIRVFPGARLSGSRQFYVEEGILSDNDYRLTDPAEYTLAFEDIKPALRLSGQGVIVPDSEGLIFPFEAVNLRAVEVRVIRIYEDNVGHFLQVNKLDGDQDLRLAGRLIHRQTITLASSQKTGKGRWGNYSIDLSKLIKAEPGAIYRVELGFNRSHSTYPCPEHGEHTDDLTLMELPWDDSLEREMAYWNSPGGYYEGYDYYAEWNWREMDNPCHDAYYGRRRWVGRNVLASNLGIIAKGGSSNNMTFAVTDLRTTQPLPNVTIEIYNLQQRLMGTVETDRNGMAAISLESKPFLLKAKHHDQRGYLRLDDGSSLSLSRFDVGGDVVQRGIKGFLYGERGVWRPGDSLFVCFILEDKPNNLPPGHPVIFELINPMGQVVQRLSRTHGHNGFYTFHTATSADAPTGNWMGKITVGGISFQRTLKIEAIKPNRLKIDLDFGVDKLVAWRDTPGILKAAWLHGATARNLRATATVTLQQMHTAFPGYHDFVFDDPVRSFTSHEITILDKKTDEEGTVAVVPDLGVQDNAPGMLRAGFVVRVFEESGDYSIDRFSLPYSPYRHYVGLRTPLGDTWRNMLFTGTDHTVDVVTLDAGGNPVSRNNLEVNVYKVEWRWWWDASPENLASYTGSARSRPVVSKRISTANGEGSFTLHVDDSDWGRYLIRITDPVSGHSSGKIVYADWPGWASRAMTDDPSAAAMLTFSVDKEKYQVGENVTVTIPAGNEGRALVSLESGSDVIRTWWMEAMGSETSFSFAATPEMSPNAYIHVSLLQPHARTDNDLPVRLYGVVPLFVEDPGTRLQPVINMPSALKPEEEARIDISEANGKKMTYTIAVVDEGLLDLTRFPTPDPWSTFYAREALGVRTWDMYDHVLGVFGGRFERVFSIGGDEDPGMQPEPQANRFPPMVRFIGPFTVEKGRTSSHRINVPKYVGSVRIMVVAGDQGAYGKAEKTVPVKNPLMVLATLPRVLTPAETVKLPVTVFAMEPGIRNVTVEVTTNDLLQLRGEKTQQVLFDRTGDQVINFELEVAEAIGVGTVNVNATSGRERASYDIEIDVRNPNPPISWYNESVLEKDEEWTLSYTPLGIKGTNSGILEISSIPPADFGRRLNYLLSFPHGCAEQVTSAAFPQLFLSSVMEPDPEMTIRIRNNVGSALRTLASYQRPSGGIGYWPGSREAADWATTYAGHFMLEAEAKGYALPAGMRNSWLQYQRSTARNWTMHRGNDPSGRYSFNDLRQAYRLYTLALAGAPEMGAMNRLRETSSLSLQARWRLAAAYALAGQPEAAQELIDRLQFTVSAYPPFNPTYGTRERDLAMILETLTLMNKRDEAIPVLQMISEALSSEQWMSTQTTAYCLLSVAKFAGTSGTASEIIIDYSLDGTTTIKAHSMMPVVQVPLDIRDASPGQVHVKNNSDGILFARLTLNGIPETGAVTASERNLRIAATYLDMSGQLVNIDRITQGTDFMARVRVTNPGQMGDYTDMVLSQVFPSGWEILPVRMDGVALVHQVSEPTYQDVRDDRVHTHFDLAAGETKEFVVLLNAAYLGRFYLPGVFCEAMYNNRVSAQHPGQWVEVVMPGTN